MSSQLLSEQDVGTDAFVALIRAHATVTRQLNAQLSADHGLTIWLDGQAASLAGQTATFNLAPGRHVVTVAIDIAAFPLDALRVRLDRAAGGVQLVSGK